MADNPVQDVGEAVPLSIDPELCNGCVICLKACPAQAIRVRGGLARVESGVCVACGECFRVCPRGAIKLKGAPLADIKQFRHAVATASPTLFSQFGYDATPNQVLLALKSLGFEEVEDLTLLCEMTAVAMEEHLLANPGHRPGISPLCPVVVKLIARRFPSLIGNLLPIQPVRQLAALRFKQRLAARHGWAEEEIGIFIISPCAAKLADGGGEDASALAGLICIPEIYGRLRQELKGIRESQYVHQESGRGLAWAVSGGQASSFESGRTLSASGFDEVVNILEMAEGGRLDDIDFIEAHICRGGCVGGPLTVENRYRANSVIKALIKKYGDQPRVEREQVRRLLTAGYFADSRRIAESPLPPIDPEPGRAIEKIKRVEEIAAFLPGSECGLCGSPDCRTFATDVVMGRAELTQCPSFRSGVQINGRQEKGLTMTVRDLADKLGLGVAAGAEGLDREVNGGYISDLMSDVMAHAAAGSIWLTVQVHPNLVAVAVLRELAAVCLVGGRTPQEETADKADAQGLPILTSSEDAFTLAGRLHELGLGG